MKQDQKAYKHEPTGVTTAPADSLIPEHAEPPRPFTPPSSHVNRPLGIEWLGLGGVAAILLFLFVWLLSIPASGENSYYDLLLSGKVTEEGEDLHSPPTMQPVTDPGAAPEHHDGAADAHGH
jgi:hypothetical protein